MDTPRSITEAELLAALLEAAQVGESDRQGMTAYEIQEHYGWSEKHTRRMLRRLVRSGQVTARPITVIAINGVLARSYEYVPVQDVETPSG